VDHENIHVHSLPRKFPSIIGKIPSNILQKLEYRIALRKLKKRHKGTPYDISLGWDEKLVQKLDELQVQTSFTWVFATGSPWNLLKVIAQWKQNKSGVKFWADLRDPWLKATNYGIPALDYQKKTEENDKAFMVYRYAEVLSAPYQEILDEFNVFERSVNRSAQRILLPHFHCASNVTRQHSQTKQSNLHLVYAGEIYLGAEQFFKKICDDLGALKISNEEVYHQIRISIFAPNFKKIEPLIEGLEHVHAQGSIGKEIENVIREANYCMLVPAEHNKDFLTTKYFEFQAFGTPYLVCGARGKVLQTVIQENRGYSWDEFVTEVKDQGIEATKKFTQEASAQDHVSQRVDFIERIMTERKP
jgi:hypothetical protein